MATVDECVAIQQQQGILSAPTSSSHRPNVVQTSPTLQIALKNNTTSANLYAYVTGLDINNGNSLWMLKSDGSSSYYPAQPPANQTPLAADCAVVVGGPGSVRTVTVPQLAGARIWFCQDTKLTFLLNIGGSGPGLVEPSVMNKSDPNYALRWDFCEFTYNSSQLFANISYVDFVSIPVALHLTSNGSADQRVEGIPADGLTTICQQLQAQQTVDCAGWDQLVVQISSPGTGAQFLRALSPYCGRSLSPTLFDNYFEPYVAQCWETYKTKTLSIDTQGPWGVVHGRVDGSGRLTFAGVGSFTQPSTADILSCNSGPFATDGEMGNLTARLAAALHRGTLNAIASQPGSSDAASSYYKLESTVNHYSRIMHSVNLDGRGYAFPYDDVTPNGGVDQSGAVSSGQPKLLTVYIGGGGDNGAATSASTRSLTSDKMRVHPIRLREMTRPGKQLVGGRNAVSRHWHGRRSLPEEVEEHDGGASVVADEKQLLREAEAQFQSQMVSSKGAAIEDLEKGAVTVPSAAMTPRDLTTRLALLLHQMLVCLWMAVAAGARATWAMVPQQVTAPVNRLARRVAETPAVAAAATGAASLVSCVVTSVAASAVASALLRPVVVRTALTGVVLLVTYLATMSSSSGGMSPAVSSVVQGVAGWVHDLTAAAPQATTGALLQTQ